MGTLTAISMEVYDRTSYRPDREYIDGELRERNVGKWEHARLQWLLAQWLGNNEQAWGVMGSTEQRTRVSATRICIPDLVVLRPGTQTAILTAPPLLVIEILSPDDTYTDTQQRAADYLRMGVPMIWVIDPETRTGRMCHEDTWTEAHRLEVPGTPIYVDLHEIFRHMDQPLS